MTPFPNRDRKGAAIPRTLCDEGPLPYGRGSDKIRATDGQIDAGEQHIDATKQQTNATDGRIDMSDQQISTSDNWPLAYLITFPTYGTWLHGDARGSVDRDHNIPGTPMLDANEPRESSEERRLKQDQVLLDARRRGVVNQTILEVAAHRDWTVHALNVRTNHVHAVIGARETPERVMNTLKSWCTRRMVEARVLPPNTKAWVRHGSTRYLWKLDEVEAACTYACDAQGDDLNGAI
ncbi:MAG: transposase [Phycisphaerales bacterium]|nr:MAG: transposase [Phycisphaerales bacterium]